jgi:hypothetical protein
MWTRKSGGKDCARGAVPATEPEAEAGAAELKKEEEEEEELLRELESIARAMARARQLVAVVGGAPAMSAPSLHCRPSKRGP